MEAKGNAKTGKRVSFNFSQRSYAKELLVEAFIYDAEGKTPPGIVVKPRMGDRKILNTEILNAEGGKITQMTKYGQSITLRATTENMLGEVLKLSIWERDTLSDKGHDPNGNQLLWSGVSKKVTNKGIGEQTILLSPSMMLLAKKSMFDGSEHEYYLLVEADKMKTISATTPVSTEIVLSQGDFKIAKREPAPEKETKTTDQTKITVKNTPGSDPIKVEGVTKAVVDMPEEIPKVEGILTAYFAKEEFTKEGAEAAGEHKYTFQSNNTNIDKNKVAGIIKKKVDAQVKADKKYAKLDDIKTALTAVSYNKGESIIFNLHKLEANFIKINSAPLEEEVYVVAKTFLLDGKEVTIKIKEKEAVLVGAGADLTVLEAKENGAEITTLKATVEKGIAKVKIKLRPKGDETLTTWKETLANGIKDGTHKYKVSRPFTVSGDLDKIAGNIERNSNTALAPNHVVKKSDISKLLAEGASYTSSNSFEFPKYKKEKIVEMLWLDTECQGDTKNHKGEFLKKDGEYFQIGKKCECEEKIRAFMRVIRIAEGTGEYVKGSKVARDPQLGYTTWFSGSGNNFTLSDDHPRVINSNSTNTLRSSAAGAYQIMSWKYDELNGYTIEFKDGYFQKKSPEKYLESSDKAKKYNAKGFSQESQDKLCVAILKALGVTDMLLKNNVKGAISKSSGTWVSLPGATAGQPTAKMQETLDYYDEFLKEELAGKSHLHIQKGFLKEFGIICNCGNESSSTWHHPVNNPQLRGWYSVWAPERSIRSDNIVGRSKGKHDGLDLYAPTGTDLFACVDGEINEIYFSETYGNCVNIKGEYNGKTYWFFYAHLSETTITAKDKDGNSTKVSAGDKIGKSGKTGSSATALNANQVHLHFEVRTTSARTGGRVDPFENIIELNTGVIKEPKKESQP